MANTQQRSYTFKGLNFERNGENIQITSDGPVMVKCSVDEWEKIERELGLYDSSLGTPQSHARGSAVG